MRRDRVVFHSAAGFADQHHKVGLLIRLKQRQHVGVGGADHRVAAETYDAAVAEAALLQIFDHLVGQRATFRYDTDAAGPNIRVVQVGEVRLAGADDAGRVGTQQARAACACVGPHADCVVDRNVLGVEHQRGDAGVQ